MFRPQKQSEPGAPQKSQRHKLEPWTKNPSLSDVKAVYDESNARRGSLVEIAIRRDTLPVFVLTCQYEPKASEPVWSLYEGEDGSKVCWSYPNSNVDMIWEIICMSMPGGVEHSPLPSALSPKAPAPQQDGNPSAAPGQQFSGQPGQQHPGAPAPYPPHQGYPQQAQPQQGYPQQGPPAFPQQQQPFPPQGYPQQPYPQQPQHPQQVQQQPYPQQPYPQQPYPQQAPQQPYPQQAQQQPYPQQAPQQQPYPQQGYPQQAPYPQQQGFPSHAPQGYPQQQQPQVPPQHPPSGFPAAVNPADELRPQDINAFVDLLSKGGNTLLLGHLFVEAGVLPEPCVEAALKLQELVRKGLLSNSAAIEALRRAAERGGLLDDDIISACRAQYPESLTQSVPTMKTTGQTLDPREVARQIIVLVLQAGIVTENDVTTAEGVRRKHGGDVGSILVAAGKIEKATLEAAKRCQPLVREHRLNNDEACRIIRHCQKTRGTVEDAVRDLSIRVI